MGHNSYLKVKCMYVYHLCTNAQLSISKAKIKVFLNKFRMKCFPYKLHHFCILAYCRCAMPSLKSEPIRFINVKKKKSWKKFLLGKRSMWTVWYYLCIIIKGLEMRLRVFFLFFIATIISKIQYSWFDIRRKLYISWKLLYTQTREWTST